MQHGCMERLNRKRGPEVWQFRWSVNGADGKRLYHKKIIGTVERMPRIAPSWAGFGNQHRWQSNEFRPDDRCPTLRSFRATRTREGKHLAESRYQESLQSVLEPLDSSPLAETRACRGVGSAINVLGWASKSGATGLFLKCGRRVAKKGEILNVLSCVAYREAQPVFNPSVGLLGLPPSRPRETGPRLSVDRQQ